MKIEIYNEPQEKEEVLSLRLRHGIDCVYIDAFKENEYRAIAWVTNEGKVYVNTRETLGGLNLTFMWQAGDS